MAASSASPRGARTELPLPLGVLLGYMALYGVLAAPSAGAAPWDRDEDLRALGSLDRLLAYEEGVQEAVEKAEDAWDRADGDKAAARPPQWQAAEPDPQLYLLTEYDRGQGQGRVKRNREATAAALGRGGAVRVGGGPLGSLAMAAPGGPGGLRRHARNPGSSGQRLSIVNPLDVLRQRLLLEIARRRKASVPQSNREMLEGIGKRSYGPAVPGGPGGPATTSVVDQAIDRCLSQLDDSRPRDVSRLGLVYWAIAYGKCDFNSIAVDETDQRQIEPKQRQQPQQQLAASAPAGASRVSRSNESDEQVERAQALAQTGDAEEDWGTAATGARRQATAWSRNARAAASNYTS